MSFDTRAADPLCLDPAHKFGCLPVPVLSDPADLQWHLEMRLEYLQDPDLEYRQDRDREFRDCEDYFDITLMVAEVYLLERLLHGLGAQLCFLGGADVSGVAELLA